MVLCSVDGVGPDLQVQVKVGAAGGWHQRGPHRRTSARVDHLREILGPHGEVGAQAFVELVLTQKAFRKASGFDSLRC